MNLKSASDLCNCGHPRGFHDVTGECFHGACSCNHFGHKPVVDILDLLTALKERFPHGHPDFIPALLDMMQLHSDKNHDYAGSGPPLGNFDRVAAILKMYPNFPYDTPAGVAVIYMLKQLDAALWIISQKIEASVEGVPARFGDIAVYSKLIPILLKEAEAGKATEVPNCVFSK